MCSYKQMWKEEEHINNKRNSGEHSPPPDSSRPMVCGVKKGLIKYNSNDYSKLHSLVVSKKKSVYLFTFLKKISEISRCEKQLTSLWCPDWVPGTDGDFSLFFFNKTERWLYTGGDRETVLKSLKLKIWFRFSSLLLHQNRSGHFSWRSVAVWMAVGRHGSDGHQLPGSAAHPPAGEPVSV